MLFYAHYYSRLQYGIHIWFPLLRLTLKKDLNIMHKRIVRILNKKCSRDHCMPLFKSMRILVINDMVCLEHLKLLHRVTTGVAPLPIVNLFSKPSHQYCTRGTRFTVPRHTWAVYNNSFMVSAIRAWDSLKIENKGILKLHSLVKLFKKQCFDGY